MLFSENTRQHWTPKKIPKKLVFQFSSGSLPLVLNLYYLWTHFFFNEMVKLKPICRKGPKGNRGTAPFIRNLAT